MDSPPTGATTEHRGTRRFSNRDRRRIVALIIAALAAAWLIAFILSNSEHVKVSFVFGDVSLSLIWVMIICAVLGALLALTVPRLLRRRSRRSG